MTDEQICEMVNRHRVLIRNEMKILIHRINHEPNAEVLQEAFNNKEWITISIGPETHTNDIHKINTAEMVRVFLKLCAFSLDNIKGTSIKISRSLNEIRGFFK